MPLHSPNTRNASSLQPRADAQAPSAFASFLILLFLLIPAAASAQLTVHDAFPNLEFKLPTDFEAPPTSSNLVFVTQKNGLIYVLENDSATTDRTAFLDLRNRVLSREEQGLFSLAFHPDYANNGYFYVHHTAPDPRRSVIARYQADPDNPRRADKTSRHVLLELEQPHSTHNGGGLGFGPDGYLYISFGDGHQNPDNPDPYDNGQDRSTLFASILRINPDTTVGDRNYGIPDSNPFVGDSTCGDGTEACRGEIYAYGFRNPWQFSFDPKTGRLWVGDVGQSSYEEVDVVKKGHNYGWSIMEASHCFQPSTGCDTTGLTMPVYEYPHTQESRKSVTGGVVYRGSDIPSLQGMYIFADYVTSEIFALTYEVYDGTWSTRRHTMFEDIHAAVAFGTDRQGDIYIVTFNGGGRIYTIDDQDDTAVRDGTSLPNTVQLLPNHPNPFNPSTRIQYQLPRTTNVTLQVYNAAGQKITTLVNRRQSAGSHTAIFKAENISSGIYYYRLKTPDATKTGSMTLVK